MDLGGCDVSADGSITQLWADGEYRFRLPIGQLRELQNKTEVGPPELFYRLGSSTWRVDDVRETIRLGLIGGGLSPTAALVLVIQYVDARPLMENVSIATKIIGAALVGDPSDQPRGKGSSEEAQASSGSASPTSMEQEPSLGSTRDKSTTSRSGNSRSRRRPGRDHREASPN